MKRYDYALFFEDGTKEVFYLEYGPENEESPGAAVMITDWRNDEHMQRFNLENAGKAFYLIEELDRVHSLAFIFVNPPVEVPE